MQWFTLSLCFLLFMTLLPTSYALKCYACAAGTDGCGPSFKKSGSGVVTTSIIAAKHCTKYVATSNNNAVMRAYSISDTCSTNTDILDGIEYTEYCCSTDLCNDSIMTKASWVFTAIVAVIALLRFK